MEEFMKKPLDEAELKDLIYDLMNGSIDLNLCPFPVSKLVENEFENGKDCEKFYQQIYDARLRLCERLGVEEDQDVETIIYCTNAIARVLAGKMFDYGVKREVFYQE